MSGRPPKTTVDYFSHDCKHGKTIFVLEQLYGNDGFAFWYKLLELLGDTPGHAYNFNNPEGWQYLLAYTKVSEEKAILILNTLLSLNKIDKGLYNTKIIWCQNFVNRLAGIYEKRDTPLPLKPKTGVGVPNNDINGISATKIPLFVEKCEENSIIVDDNTQSKAKESKLNNNISKDIFSVFEFWNEQKIIIHRSCNGAERSIKKILNTYTVDEIKQTIKNYAEILHGNEYYWKYTWTLNDFLKRGFEKFIDGDIARNNYKTKKKKGIEVQQDGKNTIPE